MNNMTSVLMFVLGAAVGSTVTWKFIKTKYERIADEEIESIKEIYTNKYKIANDSLEEKPDLSEYAEKLKQMRYSIENEENKEDEKLVNGPYVISPEHFGDCDYAIESLNYYSDGVLTNDWDEVIYDIDDIVGEDSLKRFGEFEEDSVFVRNEKYEIDYEICRDLRNYSDVKNIDDSSYDE